MLCSDWFPGVCFRQFEREQQHALSELQSKARREKNELIAALLEAADRGSLPMSGVSFIDDAVVTLQGTDVNSEKLRWCFD